MNSTIRRPRPIKVVITNIVALNPGDAAILRGTIQILRARYGTGTEILVYDRRAAVAQRLYPWAHFRQALYPAAAWPALRRLLTGTGHEHWADRIHYARHALAVILRKKGFCRFARCLVTSEEAKVLADYQSADLILSAGGTYLTENYSLLPAIRDLRLSRLSGTPYGFFTQSLGPFHRPQNRAAFRSLFRQASIILLRDERSKLHVCDLGLSDRNIAIVPDAAFVLRPSEPLRSACTTPLPPAPRVAISVRELRHFAEERTDLYHRCLCAMVEHAVTAYNARITFLSTCQGIPEYWTDDSWVAALVTQRLSRSLQSHVTIDRTFREPTEFISALHAYDAVIATRMHAAILSICSQTATAAIGYEFKLEELYKNIDTPELCLPVASLSVPGSRRLVDRLLGNLEEYTEKSRSISVRMKASAMDTVQALPEIGHAPSDALQYV